MFNEVVNVCIVRLALVQAVRSDPGDGAVMGKLPPVEINHRVLTLSRLKLPKRAGLL